MEQFLSRVASKLEKLHQYSCIDVVLGNESCDLDSAVSAIVYAYYLDQKNHDESTVVVPVLNIPQSQFRLRTETTHFFNKLHIPFSDLVFKDQVDFKALHSDSSLRLILVDHNVLTGDDGKFDDCVTTVIDHHVKERLDSDKVRLKLDFVGSCCTLVAEELLDDADFHIDDQVAELLYGTILVDTINRSAEAGKVTPRDEQVLGRLQTIIPDVKGDNLFEELQAAKFDISELMNMEILEKDLKMVVGSGMTIAMSSVTMDMKIFLSRPNFKEDLETFCTSRNSDVVVIMTLVNTEDGRPQRQIAVYSQRRIYKDQIADALDNAADVDLELDPMVPPFDEISVFHQNNVKASRKIVMPVLKSFLHGDLTPDVASKEFITEQSVAMATEGFSSFSNIVDPGADLNSENEREMDADSKEKVLFDLDSLDPLGPSISNSESIDAQSTVEQTPTSFDLLNLNSNNSTVTDTGQSETFHDFGDLEPKQDINPSNTVHTVHVQNTSQNPFGNIKTAEKVPSAILSSANSSNMFFLMSGSSDLADPFSSVEDVLNTNLDNNLIDKTGSVDDSKLSSDLDRQDFLRANSKVEPSSNTFLDSNSGNVLDAEDEGVKHTMNTYTRFTDNILEGFDPFSPVQPEVGETGTDLSNINVDQTFLDLNDLNVQASEQSQFEDMEDDENPFGANNLDVTSAYGARPKARKSISLIVEVDHNAEEDNLAELNESDFFDKVPSPEAQNPGNDSPFINSGMTSPFINYGISTPLQSRSTVHSGRGSESGSDYPPSAATPPHSHMDRGLENISRDHALPSFNSAEMVERIHKKKASLGGGIDFMGTNVLGETSVPYTPQNSFRDDTDSFLRDYSLPNLDNSNMLQKVQEKRDSLGDLLDFRSVDGDIFGAGIKDDTMQVNSLKTNPFSNFSDNTDNTETNFEYNAQQNDDQKFSSPFFQLDGDVPDGLGEPHAPANSFVEQTGSFIKNVRSVSEQELSEKLNNLKSEDFIQPQPDLLDIFGSSHPQNNEQVFQQTDTIGNSEFEDFLEKQMENKSLAQTDSKKSVDFLQACENEIDKQSSINLQSTNPFQADIMGNVQSEPDGEVVENFENNMVQIADLDSTGKDKVIKEIEDFAKGEVVEVVARNMATDVINHALDIFPDMKNSALAQCVTVEILEGDNFNWTDQHSGDSGIGSSESPQQGPPIHIKSPRSPRRRKAENQYSVETDYLPSMDPLHGSLNMAMSHSSNTQTVETDADKEVVESESFRRVSGEMLPSSNDADSSKVLTDTLLEEDEINDRITDMIISENIEASETSMLSNESILSGFSDYAENDDNEVEGLIEVSDVVDSVEVNKTENVLSEKNDVDKNDYNDDSVVKETDARVENISDIEKYISEAVTDTGSDISVQGDEVNLSTASLDLYDISIEKDSESLIEEQEQGQEKEVEEKGMIESPELENAKDIVPPRELSVNNEIQKHNDLDNTASVENGCYSQKSLDSNSISPDSSSSFTSTSDSDSELVTVRENLLDSHWTEELENIEENKTEESEGEDAGEETVVEGVNEGDEVNNRIEEDDNDKDEESVELVEISENISSHAVPEIYVNENNGNEIQEIDMEKSGIKVVDSGSGSSSDATPQKKDQIFGDVNNEVSGMSSWPNDLDNEINKNNGPLIDASMTESSLTVETISPVETPTDEHVTGFYEVNPEIKIEGEITKSQELNASFFETNLGENETGFYEITPEISSMVQSSTTAESVSPLESPTDEHVKGFYDVSEKHSSELTVEDESEMKPYKKVLISDHLDVVPEIDVSMTESISTVDTDNSDDEGFYAMNAELQGTVLQNIEIGNAFSPVESPNEDIVGLSYQINPLIPDMMKEDSENSENDESEIPDTKLFERYSDQSEVLDRSCGSEEKFVNIADDLVTEAITGAMEIVQEMRFQKDEAYIVTEIADAMAETDLGDTSDSDSSSTTTEGSYRISNSIEVSPVNTPETSSFIDEHNKQINLLDEVIEEVETPDQSSETNLYVEEYSKGVDIMDEILEEEEVQLNSKKQELKECKDMNNVEKIEEICVSDGDEDVEDKKNYDPSIVEGMPSDADANGNVVPTKCDSFVLNDDLLEDNKESDINDAEDDSKDADSNGNVLFTPSGNENVEKSVENASNDKMDVMPEADNTTVDDSVTETITEENQVDEEGSLVGQDIEIVEKEFVKEPKTENEDKSRTVLEVDKNEFSNVTGHLSNDSKDKIEEESYVVKDKDLVDKNNRSGLARQETVIPDIVIRTELNELITNEDVDSKADTSASEKFDVGKSKEMEEKNEGAVSGYTTRKEIFYTSAGRMSISIDSVADPPSDTDQIYVNQEHDIIHEEHEPVDDDDINIVDEKDVSPEPTAAASSSSSSRDQHDKMKAMDDTQEWHEDPIPGLGVQEEGSSESESDSDSDSEYTKPARPDSLLTGGRKKKKIAAHSNIMTHDSTDDLVEGVDDLPTPDDLETPDDMEGELEWEDDTPITPSSENKKFVEYREEEMEREQRENTQFRKVEIAGKDYRVDMHVIEPYKKVLSHGGYYGDGLNAIILFSGCYLPDRSRRDYQYVMDNLFLYVISTLELLVAEDYMIVYFHGATPRRQMPSFGWLKRCYQMIDRRLRKNLKALLMIHPTLWLKTVVMMTKPFISSKFSSKLRFVKTLHELGKIVPMEYIYVPDPVQTYDSKLIRSRSSSSSTPVSPTSPS